jgi:hypothetical protein
MWEVARTETTQVKESKTNSTLIQDFEMFKKELDESIEEMSTRFVTIVNEL